MLMKCVLLPLLSLFGVAASLAAHPVPELVKDINTGPAEDEEKVQFPTAVGKSLFFTAWDVEHGRELWKSDGTAQGTALLKDVFAGSGSSFPRELTAVGGMLYFVADDFQHGFQLWKSDGTPDGTQLVKDLAGDTSELAPKSLVAGGNKLFFLLPTANGPDRLWTSDGTTEGTVEVLPNNTSTLSPHDLVAFKDTVVFVRGSSLYRSDGTAAGTISLGRIRPSQGDVQWFVGDDILYFFIGGWPGSLWKSDGTSGGTGYVTSVWRGGIEGAVISNTLVFSGANGDVGSELWCSDGTSAGTRFLKDLAPGTYSDGSPYGSYPEDFTVAGGFVYFTATQPATGRELWRTDGTEKGTVLVAGATRSWFQLQPVGGQLYFTKEHGLWVTDGFQQGTRLVKSEWKSLRLLPSGDDALFLLVAGQLCRTDGIKRGMFQRAQLSQLTQLRERPAGVNASPIFPAGERAFFCVQNGVRPGLWASRGTGNSTNQIKESIWAIWDVRPVGNRAVFFAGPEGYLWSSDGTSRGTCRLFDGRGTRWDPANLYLNIIGTLGNELYFTTGGYEKFTGEIWKTNGTLWGTRRVRAAGQVPVASVSNPATDETMFFSNGGLLYRTDGTARNTYVIDETPQKLGSRPVRLNNEVYYFSVFEKSEASGLYCSDGTLAGTRRLIAGLGCVSDPIIFKGKVFAIIRTQEGYGLWSTDGTRQGSYLVVKGEPFDALNYSAEIFVAGNHLYLTYCDASDRLWLRQFDGSSFGTVVVNAANPQRVFFQPYRLPYTVIGSVVYFSAFSEMEGWELWRTDGTAVGTRMVADLTGDSASSAPNGFGLVGSQLLFWATTTERGRQLYSLDVSADLASPP